jgi:S1-C subfamily serine protease
LGCPPSSGRSAKSPPCPARAAGIHPGDIITGIDGKRLEMDTVDFLRYVERHYLVGDRVMVNILRYGKRMDLNKTLLPLR